MNKYVVIEREYGSGATKIGEEFAKECGISCYGKEIPELAAKKMHLSVDEIMKSEEKATNSLLYSLYMLSRTGDADWQMLSDKEKLFLTEQNIIKELARKGSCVFIGHCAYEALKEYDNVISVFIHADDETKHKRIQEDYNIPKELIVETERKMNKRRANYFEANTEKKWKSIDTHDIVLDSGKLGIENCVRVLKGLFED